MTTDVTAADLAAALREAVHNTKAVGWLEDPDPDYDYQATERWQSLLDRWDAQCREEIEDLWMEISDDANDRDWSMKAAKKCKLHGGEAPTITRLTQQARAANHRILALRRQLRALGGEA